MSSNATEAEIPELSAAVRQHASLLDETEAAIRRAEHADKELRVLEARQQQRAEQREVIQRQIDELERQGEEDTERASELMSTWVSQLELRHLKRVASRMREEQRKLAADYVGDILDCVVCLEPPSYAAYVYSCAECGNVMCSACAYQLDRCPSCRQCFEARPFVRNRAAERIARRITARRRCDRHQTSV